MIIVGSRTFRCEIQQLINSIWNKEEMLEEWKESIIGPVLRRVIKQIIVMIEGYGFFAMNIHQFYSL
jgi:hypothetical protein